MFKTTSLNLAAYLVSKGYQLVGKEASEEISRLTCFVFGDEQQGIRAQAQRFLVGQGGKVDVHEFLNAQKRLKNLIHEASF